MYFFVKDQNGNYLAGPFDNITEANNERYRLHDIVNHMPIVVDEQGQLR